MAITQFNNFLQPAHHHHDQINLHMNSNVTINDQLLIRITKEQPKDGYVNATEPTPKGIHHDGTEISSVTLI